MTMMMYGYTNASWSVDFFVLGASLAYRKDIRSGDGLLYVTRDWTSGTTTDDLFIYHVCFFTSCALNDLNYQCRFGTYTRTTGGRRVE